MHLKTTYRVWGAALAYAERTAAGQVSPGAEPDAVRLGPLDGPFGIWRRLRWTNSGREQHHRRKFAAMPEAAMPENDRRAAPRALNSGRQPCHLQRAMTLFTGSDPRHRIRPPGTGAERALGPRNPQAVAAGSGSPPPAFTAAAQRGQTLWRPSCVPTLAE